MKEKKESINPVADRVEKNTKRYSDGAENFIRGGLDVLEDIFGKLLEVPRRAIDLAISYCFEPSFSS